MRLALSAKRTFGADRTLRSPPKYYRPILVTIASMNNDLDLAGLAALIGDPARARMLTAVMSGKALTATELALEAGVAASTASAHLAKLTEAQILAIEKQGRHRYFRIFDAEVATMLEGMMEMAARRGPRRRTGPADPALRLARVCYDHLAGERGV
jgi:DNA-binding transcriptional ArsR family regulator